MTNIRHFSKVPYYYINKIYKLFNEKYTEK